jgi:acetyltransferase-like isoleucine patch superfamily enzyme
MLVARGARIGRGTRVPKRTMVTWPHQIKIGADCILQPDIFFNYDHYWVPGPSIVVGDKVFIGRGCEFNIRERITIGNGCLVASGCTFIDHDHGRDSATGCVNVECPGAAITIDDGAWIGANCTVLKGVQIGRHSVLGAGSVLTKSVPDREVWAGVPASRIS